MAKDEDNVYDENTFFDAFKNDLRKAQGLCLLQSPYLTLRRIKHFEIQLAGLQERGVRVCLFAQEPGGWQQHKRVSIPSLKPFEGAVEELQSFGVHVNLRTKVHEKVMVIDDFILWEGSLNPFSHYDTSERMRRWTDGEMSRKAVEKHKLNTCDYCPALPEAWTLKNGKDAEVSKMQFLGECVRNRRIAVGLSQAELARRCGVGQDIISRIEIGKRNAHLTTLIQICNTLNLELNAAPPHCLQSIRAGFEND